MVGYDDQTPYQRATADVVISVSRNVNGPLFQPDNYFRTITEETDVGIMVVDVNATDADNVSLSIYVLFF